MPSLLSTLENLIEIAKEIREIIKPKHLEAMKKCPFWSFYEPFHEGRIKEEDMKRKQKGLEFILNSFNPVKEVFVIEGKEFKSTVEQLAVIFGLHRTTTTRNPKPQIKNAARVFRETYLKGERIRKKDIKKYLYATAEDENKQDDFIKLLVLYFCVEVFFPFENGTILPMEFFNYVFVMDTVSWPDLIHSYLMKALKDAKKPIKSLRGCTVYILFWFAEVTHFTSKYEGEQGESKPRFARWNIKELAEKIANKGMTTLRQDLTGSFVDPLDDGEQSLITPVEIHQVNPDRIGGGGRMGKDRERVEDRELSPDRDAAHNLEDLAPVANLLNQESREKESQDLHGNDVHIGSSSSYAEAHSTGVESLEVGHIFLESVDATTNASSSKCSVDVIPFLTGSTSAAAQERQEGFEFADSLKISDEYKALYKKISDKYGHLATRELINSNNDTLLTFVEGLLKMISAMETVRGEELTKELLDKWEGKIQAAESLKFNVKWLRDRIDRLRHHWISSIKIGHCLKIMGPVMDARRLKYDGLCRRKRELETQLSEVDTLISQTEDEIFPYQQVIQEKTVELIKFQSEPVLVLN